MPTQLTHAHQVLIMNGVRVTGLADDENPVELPSIVLAEVKFGKDGTMFPMGTSMQGGEVMVKLLPTSPQVKDWMRKHAQIQQGARINWSGSYGDSQLGYSTLLEGGVLTEAPSGITPGGSSVEFKFQFEQITPQFDQAKFAPSPVAGA